MAGLMLLSCGGQVNVSHWQGCADGTGVLEASGDQGGADARLVVRSPKILALAVGKSLRLDGTPGLLVEYRENGASPTYVSRDVAGALEVTGEGDGSMTVAVKATARNPDVDPNGVGDRIIGGEFTAVRRSACR
jgi:hypothetical protein